MFTMSSTVNMCRFSVLFFLFLSFFAKATDLPPEHESARLMLSLASYVEQKNWRKAELQIKALSDLKTSSPTELYYFSGLVHFHLNRYVKAQKLFERYVIEAGKGGKYYSSALQLITAADEEVKSSPVEKVDVGVQSIERIKQKSDGYIKSLKALYLTNSPIDALSLQINSLLASNSYTGSRLKKTKQKKGIIYSLSVTSNSLMLQEKSYIKGLPTLKANNLNVNGLDPFIKYDCSKTELACWLYDPANNHQRWIKIDHDEMVVKELAKAFTKLIQTLQKTI